MAKVTKAMNFEAIEAILEAQGETELVAFVQNEQALLAKRNGKARGLTKTQKANEGIKENIVGMLNEVEVGMNATEIAGALEVNTQKATALLKQLVDAGAVARTEGKGKTKTVFTLV